MANQSIAVKNRSDAVAYFPHSRKDQRAYLRRWLCDCASNWKFIKKQGWMDDEEFYRLFARAQIFPGPVALTTSFLTSYRLAGVRGAIAAVCGVVLPPFIAIILVGGLISLYGDTVLFKRFLNGAGAVVPGLVGSMLWTTIKNRKWSVRIAIEVAIFTLLLVFFPSQAFFILIGGIIVLYIGRLVWKS